jgi:hypothetical protein
MCFLGIVRNGKVELPPEVQLPEGATVRVELPDEPDPMDTIHEHAVEGGPRDLASRCDWYIYGMNDTDQ